MAESGPGQVVHAGGPGTRPGRTHLGARRPGRIRAVRPAALARRGTHRRFHLARFSTVRKADRIFLFHEGRLAEQGTHSELMRLAGRYAELFTLQASAYVD